MSALFGTRPRTTSAAEIQAAQEAAAKKEKERMAQEQAIKEANSEAKAYSAQRQQLSKRAALSSALIEEDTDPTRRRYLKSV